MKTLVDYINENIIIESMSDNRFWEIMEEVFGKEGENLKSYVPGIDSENTLREKVFNAAKIKSLKDINVFREKFFDIASVVGVEYYEHEDLLPKGFELHKAEWLSPCFGKNTWEKLCDIKNNKTFVKLCSDIHKAESIADAFGDYFGLWYRKYKDEFDNLYHSSNVKEV